MRKAFAKSLLVIFEAVIDEIAERLKKGAKGMSPLMNCLTFLVVVALMIYVIDPRLMILL